MRLLALAVIGFVLSGCLAMPSVREYFDDDTAATVTVVNKDWIFARERPDLAVHAQDYITVTPLQINRSGQRKVYLYCQLWSTIDRRSDKSIVPATAELAVIADDRRVVLPRTATDIRQLGLGHAPVASPNQTAEVRAVAIDIELLRFLTNTEPVRIALSVGNVTEYYVSWRSGRAATVDFLHQVARP